MNKKIIGVFISIFVFAVLTLPVPNVCAKKPDKFVDVEGTFFPTGAPSMEVMVAGNSDNQIVYVLMPQMWTGDISGTGIVEPRWVMHNFDDAENTWVNVMAVITLTGEVACATGTVTIKFSSVSSRGGHWRIIDGTGELANVHGQGTLFATAEAMVFGYEGVIHFNP